MTGSSPGTSSASVGDMMSQYLGMYGLLPQHATTVGHARENTQQGQEIGGSASGQTVPDSLQLVGGGIAIPQGLAFPQLPPGGVQTIKTEGSDSQSHSAETSPNQNPGSQPHGAILKILSSPAQKPPPLAGTGQLSANQVAFLNAHRKSPPGSKNDSQPEPQDKGPHIPRPMNAFMCWSKVGT